MFETLLITAAGGAVIVWMAMYSKRPTAVRRQSLNKPSTNTPFGASGFASNNEASGGASRASDGIPAISGQREPVSTGVVRG